MPLESTCAVQNSRLIRRKTQFSVLFAQTDMMGVVNHAAYFSWFEEGRLEFINAFLPIADAVELDIIAPTVSCSCEYRLPVCYGDRVLLTTTHRVSLPWQGKLSFEHSLVNCATKKEHAYGTTVCTLMHRTTQKVLAELPADLLERYRQIQ